MKIPIIYQDNNIIVVDKPAGLLVHPTKDLTDSLQASLEQVQTLVDFFPNAKLVHRLDKDTSGLIILAKNKDIYNWLKEQFKQRKIIKEYLALVHGILKDKNGIIARSISKTRKHGGRQTITPIGKKREAITKYLVLKEYKQYSLLKVLPKTGRTHQIRVHLSSAGHPVVGDEKYKFKRQKTPEKLKRQFLHANYLQFQMPNGKIIKLQSKLPEDLKTVLKNII